MTTVAPLTDFSDKYSPMVVKELRQGLRTKMFGGMMLGLHAILLIVTLAGISSTRGQEKEIINALISFVLYLIFPLSAFSALAGEIKANTMDMLVLSKLSAGRIVFGKWAAVVLQSLLVTISILPYMVARYFFGGSDLFSDIYFLANNWLISAVLTAAVVALSTQRQFWLRGLIVAIPVFFSGVTPIFFLFRGFSGMGSSAPPDESLLTSFLTYLPTYIWLIFALLSLAATRVAPAASMLSVPKRLVNLAALILLPLLQWATSTRMNPVLLILVMAIAASDALTEQVRPISSIYIPFYKRSWWGAIGRLFLAPGWMHGYIYSLLVVGMSVAMAYHLMGVDVAIQVFLVGCGIWFVTLLSQVRSFWTEEGDYLATFFGGLLVLAMFTLVVFILANTALVMEHNRWVMGILPTTALTLVDRRHTFEEVIPLSLIFNAVWPVLLSLFAFKSFRRTKAARLEAKHLVTQA